MLCIATAIIALDNTAHWIEVGKSLIFWLLTKNSNTSAPHNRSVWALYYCVLFAFLANCANFFDFLL